MQRLVLIQYSPRWAVLQSSQRWYSAKTDAGIGNSIRFAFIIRLRYLIHLIHPRLVVANTGDCRAVLARLHEDRTPYAMAMSIDHKPDRQDEVSRIKQAGGFVRHWGVPRVNGVLAVSRAFGDFSLKNRGTPPPHHNPTLTHPNYSNALACAQA